MINTFSYTSKGPRTINQDRILIKQTNHYGMLACVADGVGGNNGGEIAANLAINTISSLSNNNSFDLNSSVLIAHHNILQEANADIALSNMATTITAILINNNKLTGINCGDSRVYLLRNNGLKQLTTDHTELSRLISEGLLSKQDANDYPRKNVLDSALGIHKPIKIQSFDFDLKLNDRVILMTDGVYSVISKKEFRDISVQNLSTEDFGKQIISLVKNKKTNDNYSIIILDLK